MNSATAPKQTRKCCKRSSAASPNRNPYKTDPIDPQLLTLVTAHELPDVSVHVATGSEGINFLADKTQQASRTVLGESAFRRELSEWVRSNTTREFDGMPGFTQGMPTPPSLIAPHIIRHIDISKSQAKKDSARVRRSAALALVLRHDDTETASLNAGRLYARLCVQANRHGIATSGVAAAVLDPTTREQVVERLQLPHRPLALIRLGYSDQSARHTPRWPLAAVSETT